MKNALKFLALAAGMTAVAISCNKVVENPEVQDSIRFVIRAGAPETRTAITNNGDGTYTPSWSANDAIGVYFTKVSGEPTEFVNDDAGQTALFAPSNEITGVSGDQTLYAFYPLGAFNATTSGKGIRVNVKDTQTPASVETFDATTDLLVAKPYPGNITTITEDGGIIDLAFARILSVVKVTPTDATPDGLLSGEYVKSVKIEYNAASDDDPLSGRVVLDLETGELGDWTIKSYSVSAGYDDNVFALNGTNAAYILVNPATIASGKKVTFTVKTNKHDVSKEFTLERALAFPAGNIATIGLSIDNTWTFVDNTLDPNIIFQTPFYADISSNTTYDPAIHGNLGVVGTSKSTISYTFDGDKQLRNNSNKISADDASFYYCTSSTGLVIGGINVGTNRYFALSYDFKVPSASTSLALSISNDGSHFFPITTSATVSVTGTTAQKANYSFSIPEGEYTNLRLKFENKGSNGVVIDNVTLTKLSEAAAGGQEVSFDVTAVDPTLVVTPSSPIDLIAGNTKQLTVTGTNGALTFSSNNTDVATVTSEGLITAVAEGTATIDIASAATEDYNAGSTSVIVNVSAALSFETIVITETWSADLKSNTGNNAKFVDDGQGIWAIDATYGRKAANNANPASFYSPKFDMSGVDAGTITFDHSGNATGDAYQSLGKAYYSLNDGEWIQITLDNPSSNWQWKTATIASSVYAGKTIQFRWDFQGNAQKTWEVRDFVITVPSHEIRVNDSDSPLTVVLNGDKTKTTKLTVASGFTWSVKSTTGLNTAYTYTIDSDTQITVTPVADNNSGSTITGIGKMVLTDGTVDFSISFDQANKSQEPSWNSESWSSLATNITSYANGSGTVEGDLGTWTYAGIVTSGQTEHTDTFTSKVMTLGSTSDNAKITSPTFENGVKGIKFNYYTNNTARKFKVTIYEDGTSVKSVTITPEAANALKSYEVEGVSTTGETYFTIEPTTSSRRVSIGDVQVMY